MLKKEYQTMYNNSQMSKAELMKLNRELEQTQITLKKLSELDPSKIFSVRLVIIYFVSHF